MQGRGTYYGLFCVTGLRSDRNILDFSFFFNFLSTQLCTWFFYIKSKMPPKQKRAKPGEEDEEVSTDIEVYIIIV